MKQEMIPRYTPEEVLSQQSIEVNTFNELYQQKIAQETIYKSHRASFYHIFWYQGDDNLHYIEGKTMRPEYNSVLIINANIVHRYAQQICAGNMILFSSTFFETSQERTEFLSRCSLFHVPYVILKLQSPELTRLLELYFSLMKKIYGQTDLQNKDVLSFCLHNLLIILERQYKKQYTLSPDNSDKYLPQFGTLLRKFYTTEKTVQFYAKKLGLSERKLSQLIFEKHGVNAKELISETLLQKAINIVKNTTMNQNEIADYLGLDFTYFVKFFRRRTGLTPAKYRQQHAQSLPNKEKATGENLQLFSFT